MTNWGLAVFIYVVGGCIGASLAAGIVEEEDAITRLLTTITGFAVWPWILGRALSYIVMELQPPEYEEEDEEED